MLIALHPNQVRAARPRFSVAGGKSDGFDSFVLAELARIDSHRFWILAPDSDRIKALRALTRSREDLVRTGMVLGNRLRDQLACFWPGAGKMFCAVDSQIALAFLKALSQPGGRAWARGAAPWCVPSPSRIYRTQASPRAARPAAQRRTGRAGELETQARRQLVLALVAALEPIVAKISELTVEIRKALDKHPDGATFRSPFIAPDSFLCAASMLAEIGDCRQRYPSYRALAADGGQSPVASESGKSKRAQFRWACDHRLREAFNVLADSSRRHNPWAADIYHRARARGASHAHAARILGRS